MLKVPLVHYDSRKDSPSEHTISGPPILNHQWPTRILLIRFTSVLCWHASGFKLLLGHQWATSGSSLLASLQQPTGGPSGRYFWSIGGRYLPPVDQRKTDMQTTGRPLEVPLLDRRGKKGIMLTGVWSPAFSHYASSWWVVCC